MFAHTIPKRLVPQHTSLIHFFFNENNKSSVMQDLTLLCGGVCWR
jgi:hypothetical protein